MVSLTLAGVARAAEILALEGPVTDTTGVLADRVDEIEAAISEATDRHGVQPFVLFVDSTEDLSAADYTAQTAQRNSLGGDDALIVVALDDRTDQIWVSDGLTDITDDELDEIIIETLEPGLRDGDFGGATIATIGALGEAADSPAGASTSPPAGGGTTDGGGATDEGGGIPWGTIGALALVAGGGYLLYGWWRRRSKPEPAPAAEAGAAGGAPPVDTETLVRQSNAALITTDERIRDARQEIDFAEAEYGAEAVVPMRKAVGQAQERLKEAFILRQRLDDGEPEDEPTRRLMLSGILEHTTAAHEMLDLETSKIRELRDLERDAPHKLVELPGLIEAVDDRLPAAEVSTARLRRYAEPVWSAVDGNVEEARKGLAGARTAVTIGTDAVADAVVADDDLSKVAVATRTALEGITGARLLLDAIDTLDATVTEAERRIPGELADAERDLTDARGALADRQASEAVAQRARAAEAALDPPTERHRANRPIRSKRCASPPRLTAWPTRRWLAHATRLRRSIDSVRLPTRMSGRHQSSSSALRPTSRRVGGASARPPGPAWPRPSATCPRRTRSHRLLPRKPSSTPGGLRLSPARRISWPRPTSPTGTRADRAGASAAVTTRRP